MLLLKHAHLQPDSLRGNSVFPPSAIRPPFWTLSRFPLRRAHPDGCWPETDKGCLSALNMCANVDDPTEPRSLFPRIMAMEEM
jgi:hypothetical protein